MEFEYNGNLEYNERINKVALEIMKTYPEISMDKAKIIASLEDSITTEPNGEIKFKRLYNILFVMQYKKSIFNKALVDIKNIYDVYILTEDNNNLIESMMRELLHYTNGERLNFPVISEFM